MKMYDGVGVHNSPLDSLQEEQGKEINNGVNPSHTECY